MATTVPRVPARGARALAALATAAILATTAGCGGDGDGGDDGADGAGSTSADTTAAAATTAGGTGTGASTTAVSPPADETILVRFLDGRVVDGPRRATVDVGDVVHLRVESDVADDVHVHGYDLTAAVAPGRPAELRFEADVPGVFEVELERRHVKILEVTVR